MEVAADAYLEHYGVKGMRWGVRRASRNKPQPRSSADAKKKDQILERRKQHGNRVLTNNDIQIAVRRIELERRIDTIAPPRNRREGARRFINSLLGDGRTVNEAISFANSPAGQAVRTGLNTRSPRAAATRAVPPLRGQGGN